MNPFQMFDFVVSSRVRARAQVTLERTFARVFRRVFFQFSRRHEFMIANGTNVFEIFRVKFNMPLKFAFRVKRLAAERSVALKFFYSLVGFYVTFNAAYGAEFFLAKLTLEHGTFGQMSLSVFSQYSSRRERFRTIRAFITSYVSMESIFVTPQSDDSFQGLTAVGTNEFFTLFQMPSLVVMMKVHFSWEYLWTKRAFYRG